jgi:hypothetical protein
MSSLTLMESCNHCGSSETELYDGWRLECKNCGVEIEYIPTQVAQVYTDKDYHVTSEGKGSEIYYLLQRQRKHENRKSPAHHEGLNFIREYPNSAPGLIEQSLIFFNKGVKSQSKELRLSNQDSKMFMPSGKSNSSLFAAFASILYAHRFISGNWNENLNFYANHIKSNHQPKRNGKEMKLSSIKRDLRSSYSKLKNLVPPPRARAKSFSNKSKDLKNEINFVLTKFNDEIKIPRESLFVLEKLEQELVSGNYNDQLEHKIPNSGLDLVAAEILWLSLNLSNKFSRDKLSKILFNTIRRTSDKKGVVKEIISIVNMEKDFFKK